jgi:hypothetical protein
MNELIEELYKQSFIEVQDENSFPCMTFSKQKFAELIVQECIRYFNEDYVRDFDTLWREDLSKGMREHFGVEE